MRLFNIIVLLLVAIFFFSCSEKEDRGVGPVKELKLGEIDRNMVQEGEDLFRKKCSTCHRIDRKLIGSALKGITERRTPEWIMNMILNPDGMINENKAAKELFESYKVRMAPESVSEQEARKILEYLRTQK
ncbi:MAG: cytochrome c [Ignavibacteria bacterium]|nr:cytochrome c [Ignavibacteria bacterium]